jgi:hypothetical protein
MFSLPQLFQQTGWVPSVLLILAVATWTNQSALYMSRTMAAFSGNAHFSKRIEFSTMVKYLLPTWAYLLAMVALCASFFSQNLANILLTSQVMDWTLIDLFGRTCAIQLYPTLKPVCVLKSQDQDSLTDSPFGNAYVVSLGYAVVLAVCIPLGYLNLDDNIGMQVGGMILTLVCVAVWVANFFVSGVDAANMPAALPGLAWSNYVPLLSTVLFNYGFVATIPSWLNEKRPSVSVTSIISYANAGATAQFLVVAIPAALAFADLPGCNLLAVINGCHKAGVPRYEFWQLSKLMTYVFPIANILTSIPVFSIIIRYNLMQLRVPSWRSLPAWCCGGLRAAACVWCCCGLRAAACVWCCCGRRAAAAEDPRHPGETTVSVTVANAIAVVAPWIAALPFYVGNQLNTLINWSSAIMFVLINMVLPLSCYLVSRAREDAGLPPVEVEERDVCETHAGGGGAERLTAPLLSEASSDDLLARYGGGGGGGGGSMTGIELSGDRGFGLDGGSYGELKASLNRAAEEQQLRGAAAGGDEGGEEGGERISPLPTCLCASERSLKAGERGYARALLVLAVLLAVATFVSQVYVTEVPPSSDDDQTDDGGGNATLVGPGFAGLLARIANGLPPR